MPFDGAIRCVGVEEEKESFFWKELHAKLIWMPPYFLGDEMKESISLWTLNSSIFHAFPLLHVLCDGSWRFIGIELEESFYLKALPHPKTFI